MKAPKIPHYKAKEKSPIFVNIKTLEIKQRLKSIHRVLQMKVSKVPHYKTKEKSPRFVNIKTLEIKQRLKVIHRAFV